MAKRLRPFRSSQFEADLSGHCSKDEVPQANKSSQLLVVGISERRVDFLCLQRSHLLRGLEMVAEERVRFLLCCLVAAASARDALKRGWDGLLGVLEHLYQVAGVRLLILHTLGVRTEEAH